MSFLQIADPTKRDQTVKEFLAIKKNIRDSELARKTGEIELQRDLSKLFKPITETQKAATEEITKGLKPIKEGIEQLPQRLPQQKRGFLPPPIITKGPFTPPPAYSPPLPSTSKKEPKAEVGGPFPEYDTEFGVYEIGGEFFMGNKSVELVTGKDGNKYINIGGKSYLLTEGLYNLLALKDPPVESITANDV